MRSLIAISQNISFILLLCSAFDGFRLFRAFLVPTLVSVALRFAQCTSVSYCSTDLFWNWKWQELGYYDRNLLWLTSFSINCSPLSCTFVEVLLNLGQSSTEIRWRGVTVLLGWAFWTFYQRYELTRKMYLDYFGIWTFRTSVNWRISLIFDHGIFVSITILKEV